MNTKIGDHFVSFICESENLKKYIRKNFNQIRETNKYSIDLVIQIKDGYGVPFYNYEVEITKINGKVCYRRADYMIEVELDFKFAMIAAHDELALKHALTNLYSSFIVHHNWGLLIHSSCVIDHGKAHIFSGPSGAGKSTAAKLSFPRAPLSDEATLVKISSEEVLVYNSPFRSELKAEPSEKIVKLESIQILKQSLQNNRIDIPMAEALIQIMDKVFFWPHNPDEIKVIMNLLTILVKNVPVYELYFQKNDTFWKLIS